jgi:hypothetical protein
MNTRKNDGGRCQMKVWMIGMLIIRENGGLASRYIQDDES